MEVRHIGLAHKRKKIQGTGQSHLDLAYARSEASNKRNFWEILLQSHLREIRSENSKKNCSFLMNARLREIFN